MEVTKVYLESKVVMEVIEWLLGGDKVWKVLARNMESTVDITEFFRKLKFVCHWADPFKDLKWSNVPGVKLSSLSKSDETFSSLEALSNSHYLFSGFLDYLWSRQLDISNFGPADRVSILYVALMGMKCADLDGNESRNCNLRAILTNGVVSCLTLSDQEYAEDFTNSVSKC
nr:hypothetical protein [Tanacetum cinerariifolium]